MKWLCCFSAVITLLVLLPPPTAAQFNQRREVLLGKKCITPDAMHGICEPLPNCRELERSFTSRESETQYLIGRKRSCDIPSINGVPVVCCTDSQPDKRRQVLLGQKCITPDAMHGTCLLMPNCKELEKSFISRESETQYLIGRKRSCDIPSINKVPVVCCADSKPARDVPTRGPNGTIGTI